MKVAILNLQLNMELAASILGNVTAAHNILLRIRKLKPFEYKMWTVCGVSRLPKHYASSFREETTVINYRHAGYENEIKRWEPDIIFLSVGQSIYSLKDSLHYTSIISPIIRAANCPVVVHNTAEDDYVRAPIYSYDMDLVKGIVFSERAQYEGREKQFGFMPDDFGVVTAKVKCYEYAHLLVPPSDRDPQNIIISTVRPFTYPMTVKYMLRIADNDNKFFTYRAHGLHIIRGKIAVLMEEKKDDDRISFLPAYTHDELPGIFKDAMFAWSGCPQPRNDYIYCGERSDNVVLEAIINGCLPVVNKNMIMREFIDKDACVPIKSDNDEEYDPNKVANELVELAKDRERYNGMVQRSQVLLDEVLDNDLNIFCNVLDEVLTNNS